MNLKKLLLTALLATSLPASAAVLTASNLNGNSFVDYSADGLLSLDLNASNTAPLFFEVSFSAGEIANGSVSFNAVINNFIAFGIPNLLLDFGSLSVTAGSVQSGFNPGPSGAWGVSASGSSFLAGNGSADNDYYGLLVGDPFVSGSLSDWQIATSGLTAGNTYAFSIQAVPEPGQLALMVAGLGALGLMRRRKQA